MFSLSVRLFLSSLETRQNEDGEYEVAKGVSATIFRAVLVGRSRCIFTDKFVGCREERKVVIPVQRNEEKTNP